MNKKIISYKEGKRYLEEWETHQEDELDVFDNLISGEDVTNDTRTDEEILND